MSTDYDADAPVSVEGTNIELPPTAAAKPVVAATATTTTASEAPTPVFTFTGRTEKKPASGVTIQTQTPSTTSAETMTDGSLASQGAVAFAQTITNFSSLVLGVAVLVVFVISFYYQWWWGVGVLMFLGFVAAGPLFLPDITPPPNENPYHTHARWVRVAIPAVIAFFVGRYYAVGVIATQTPHLKFFLPPPADRQCSLPLDIEV